MKRHLVGDHQSSSLSPGRIALGYAVIAILWIAFSDAFVTHFNLPPAVMTLTTPTGLRNVNSCLSGISLGTVWP